MTPLPADRNIISGSGPELPEFQEPATDLAGVHRSDTEALTKEELATIDLRQVEVMARDSVDGRPPTRAQRGVGWVLVMVGVPLLIVGGATWAIVTGVSVGAVLGVCVVLVLVLMLGGWPVWAASLSRGREETSARTEAVADTEKNRFIR